MDAIIYLWSFKFCFKTIKNYHQYRWILIDDLKHHQSKDEIPEGYFDEIYITDMDSYPAVEEIVREVSGRYPVKAIIATMEAAVELGGWLRSKFNIPGVQYQDAVNYRNKLKMKSLIRSHHLKTADAMLFESRDPLSRFVDEHGFPVILKPIDGLATSNTAKVADFMALERYLEQFGEKQPVLVEEFIPGEEYHCDSLVVDGEVVFVSVGKYLFPLLQAILEKKPIGSIIFPKSRDESLKKILECNQQSIKALNIQNAVCHGEYFMTPGGEVFFGELATRIGGGPLMGSCIQNTHGINIYQSFIDIELGNYQPAPPRFTGKYTGFICFPSKEGVIAAISGADDFKHIQGIVDFKLRNKIGDRITAIDSSAVRTGHAIVEAGDYETLESKLVQIYSDFRLETASPGSASPGTVTN